MIAASVTDRVIGPATAAQLEDSGLFYAFRVEGDWPGRIRFVPELPIGGYRNHLASARDAARDIDTFFGAIRTRIPPRSWCAVR